MSQQRNNPEWGEIAGWVVVGLVISLYLLMPLFMELVKSSACA